MTLIWWLLPDFDESGEGKVFSEGVPLEAVVCEDATEVGVISEEDTEHVPQLTLVPVGCLQQRAAQFIWRRCKSRFKVILFSSFHVCFRNQKLVFF